MQDEIKVTQADRDAVDDFHRDSFRALFETTDEGSEDQLNRAHTLLCQAFARHRHQAERETLARMEWRDIESAPRSTHVLINCRRWGATEAILGDGGWQGATFNGSLTKCDPTHWMPLPPAPEAGQ